MEIDTCCIARIDQSFVHKKHYVAEIMKLNYFAYTITDNNDSNIYFDNISDIIKSFCLGRERALFEKKQRIKKTLFSDAVHNSKYILPYHASNYNRI